MNEEEINKILKDSCIIAHFCYEVDCAEKEKNKLLIQGKSRYFLYYLEK